MNGMERIEVRIFDYKRAAHVSKHGITHNFVTKKYVLRNKKNSKKFGSNVFLNNLSLLKNLKTHNKNRIFCKNINFTKMF